MISFCLVVFYRRVSEVEEECYRFGNKRKVYNSCFREGESKCYGKLLNSFEGMFEICGCRGKVKLVSIVG